MKQQTDASDTQRTDLIDLASPRPPSLVRLPKVLVADDNEGFRQAIASTPTRSGFEVKVVSDGEAAWAELQQEHYDLLVTDNEMPCLAGLELIKQIRRIGMVLPVIIASGSLSEEAVHDYAELQIAAIIPKPCGLWEFMTMVNIALRAAERGTTVKFRPYANSSMPRSTRLLTASPNARLSRSCSAATTITFPCIH